jgi:hypothetical protein
MEMVQMNIVEKMNGIFENVMRNNQEWCTDHLLEIINETLHMASEIMKKYYEKSGSNALEGAGESRKIDSQEMNSMEKQAPQMIFDSFLCNFEYFIILLGASDVTIIEKSAQNILAFIHFSMI